MKRLLVIVLAAGLFAGATAYPGLTGGRGFLRVQDARSEGDWNGSLMLQGINGSYSYDEVFEPWRIGMQPGTRLNTYDLTGVVSLSPIKWFELFCWTGGALEKWRWETADSVFSGYHNLAPGAKLSLPIIPVLKLGALGAYSMYPNFGDTRGSWALGRFGIPFVNGPTWTGLATFAFPDIAKWTPVLHVNYGQAYDTDPDAPEGSQQTTYTTMAAAVEYEIGRLDIGAEFVSLQTGGAGLLDNSGKVYVTPGVKIGYLKPLILEGGVSIGLTDNVPDLEIVAGLGLSGRVFTPPKPTTGIVAGRVTDAATGKALAASVGFPGETKPMPVSADAGGMYTAKGVRAGMVRVKASAPGYVPVEKEVKVTAGKTSKVDFALSREKTTGSLVGRVTDPVSGSPLAATVRLNGGTPQSVDADGRYRFDELAAGDYTIEASADGYLTASARAQVQPRQEARADFQLVKAGVKITLKVYFDFDKAELKPESHQALADAAKIMRENPSIKVEIQGHTDNMGSADYNQRLSMRRAQAVVDYLVSKLGIEAKRLTPKGFGFTKPIASNDTDEGRAQNRRVEFFVVE